MTLEGKGMMIWKIPSCEGGDPEKIARVAAACGFSHVLIKIANDTRVYNTDKNGIDLVFPVVDALRARGIQVWGWHYVYGYDPLGEAKVAVAQTKKFSLDGYVIDAEIEYQASGRTAVARTFMDALRKGLPSTPVALSSYRWPTYHKTFPYAAFLEKCDYNMPQVYWMKAHNPAYDLNRSVTEFKALAPYRPIIPTGPAFSESGWSPSASEVRAFLDKARALGLSAANFFSWDHARLHLTDIWEVIKNYNWPVSAPIPDESLPSKIFATLNAGLYDPFLDIYATDAVLVTAKETIQGNAAIRGFFGKLLTNQLNDGVFKITSLEINGNTIHYTWTCRSYRGKVDDGSDTLGVQDGKVKYHYCHYTIV